MHLRLALLFAALPAVAAAQQSTRVLLEAELGPAFRSDSPYSNGVTQGFQALTRLAVPLGTTVRLLAEVPFVSYSDQSLASPFLCPRPGGCPTGPYVVRGLHLTGFGVGLQPHLGHGPLHVLLTGTLGGYWLYHRTPPFPALAAGLRCAAGLHVQIDDKLGLLFEGGSLFLPAVRNRAADSRHLGVGITLQ